MADQHDAPPQVLAFATVSRAGLLPIVKAVRARLGPPPYCLLCADETIICASNRAGGRGRPVEVRPLGKGLGVALPESVAAQMYGTYRRRVALVERDAGVGLKPASVRIELPGADGGRSASATDIETTESLTRTVRLNPMPSCQVKHLRAALQRVRLRYDPRCFFRGRSDLPSWRARRLLRSVEPADDSLASAFVAERINRQRRDGSWDGKVLRTAAALRELCDLRLGREHEAVGRAADWLLARRVGASPSACRPTFMAASSSLPAA